jgi:hypothetical protein
MRFTSFRMNKASQRWRTTTPAAREPAAPAAFLEFAPNKHWEFLRI